MDPVAEWAAAQARVIDLVESLDAAAVERRVPATPDWTVRDLLSHMIGLDADILAGNEPDDHNPTWTQRQVDDRAGHDVATLVAEWRAMTEPLQQWMRDNNPRPMGDVVIHEQDLRGALEAPGARDGDALRSLFERMAGACEDRAVARELEPLRLQGENYDFGPPQADVVVRASDFDLARLVLSRRSAAQLRAWTTQGDVEPYVECFGGLGPLPADDLVE
ncbi:TIGR03083 family protein [Jatrophihabitans endophyticus]|uniref:TIGR03083 family protein n=1 Tax=Jatrophihabitans endophyticus TaxID=1206085 RepID=A0A1M5IVM6_9ACTN|nr:maleylpyruvate isomerase family mycothiol-dependent enzyme [Jatrophihabitans endophyticus]SHG32392.1 TIGR03083 family protein [Jatrophihabitans endophyticus]